MYICRYRAGLEPAPTERQSFRQRCHSITPINHHLIGSHFPQNESYCHLLLIVRFTKIPVGLNRNSSASNLVFYPIYFKLPLRVIFFKKLEIIQIVG